MSAKQLRRGLAEQRGRSPVIRRFGAKASLTPMSDIDLMIKMGWGDTPQSDLPADWRTRRPKYSNKMRART